jgi:hypothetical protein
MPFFKSENDLVNTALSAGIIEAMEPSYPDEESTYQLQELKGVIGIPDLVLVKLIETEYDTLIRSISFEFKLSNWKRALIQAYKYRSFTHKSYVIMDMGFEHLAFRNIDMFIKGNVGLATVNDTGDYNLLFSPLEMHPYSSYLAKRAVDVYSKLIGDDTICQAVC